MTRTVPARRRTTLAAAVAAMMSTASGALIACATVARNDVVPFLTGRARAVDDVAVDSFGVGAVPGTQAPQ